MGTIIIISNSSWSVLALVGMVTKPSNEQSQDFSIHNEDFPALPGPNYKDPTLTSDDSKSVSDTSVTVKGRVAVL